MGPRCSVSSCGNAVICNQDNVSHINTPLFAQLTSLGIQQQFITFTNVTLESDKFICVRETAPQNQLVRDPSDPSSTVFPIVHILPL